MKDIDGTSYVYAGVSDGRARGGVGIAIAERWADCVKSWRCVSEDEDCGSMADVSAGIRSNG